MRTLFVINPSSGSGRGETCAQAAMTAARAAGHETTSMTVREWDDFAERAAGVDVVVLCGGDGTVHHALQLLRARGGEASPAIYHLPTGTENLFARQFGMTRDPARLVDALERADVRAIDLGLVRGWPFAIMVSVGPDASVIHRVSANRTGGITHWSYARPIAMEALRPALPRLTVTVERDGLRETIASAQRGWLVVANMRQYAARFDPCAGALCDDGLLDAAFFPAGTTARMIRWFVRARLRLADSVLARALGARHRRAHAVEVAALDAAPVQIDGEVGGVIEAGRGTPLRLEVAPKALRILAPG